MRMTRGHVVSTLAWIATIACQEDRQPTNPAQMPIMADWTPGPIGQSYTLPTPASNDLTTPYGSMNVSIPAGAPAKITVTGLLTFATNSGYTQCAGSPPPPPPGGIYTVGPAGFTGGDWRVGVRPIGGSPISFPSTDPSAETMTTYTQASAVQNLEAGREKALPYACGDSASPYNPAYWVSGSQTVSVEALDSAHIVSDKQSAAPGDTVTFTVQVSWSTNFAVFGSWSWISDTTTNNSTFVSNCYRQNPCKVLVREKGHVYVDWISVEGGSINLTARSPVVTIFAPTFKVTASPGSITGAQSVTFTPSATPSVPFSIAGWTWTPDSGTGGIAPNGCGPGEMPCTRTISKSGSMTATANCGPYTLTASSHVSVIPCLTGDSILDDSRIRKDLNDALNATNLTGSPWDRRERGGMRFQRPDGTIVDTLFDVGPNDGPCSFDFASRQVNGVPLVVWHSHPFTPEDPTDPLPFDPTQTPRSNCLPLANAKRLLPGQVYTAKRGPSIPNDVQGGIPSIVIEKNGSVWMGHPDQSVTPYPRTGSGVCDPLRIY